MHCENADAATSVGAGTLQFQLETTCTLDARCGRGAQRDRGHLDRYAGSMDAYAAAKARIFQGGGVQVLKPEDPRSAAMRISGARRVSFGWMRRQEKTIGHRARRRRHLASAMVCRRSCRADELQVSGLHTSRTTLAALALCRALGMPLAPLVQALRDFKGCRTAWKRSPKSRGITYYDDSKGTNVGATRRR